MTGTTTAQCVVCNSGYDLNTSNVCVTAITGCFLVDANSSKCAQCDFLYYWKTAVCTSTSIYKHTVSSVKILSVLTVLFTIFLN